MTYSHSERAYHSPGDDSADASVRRLRGRVVRSRIQPGDGDPRHGTPNGYDNLNCRCELCREAHRVRKQTERRERGALPRAAYIESVTEHGTPSRWRKGCKCEPCLTVGRRWARERAARYRAAKSPNTRAHKERG